MKKSKRGGARAGAGRPAGTTRPAKLGRADAQIVVRLPAVPHLAWLAEQAEARGVTRSRVVRLVIETEMQTCANGEKNITVEDISAMQAKGSSYFSQKKLAETKNSD
jgi:hypothetical protein